MLRWPALFRPRLNHAHLRSLSTTPIAAPKTRRKPRTQPLSEHTSRVGQEVNSRAATLKPKRVTGKTAAKDARSASVTATVHAAASTPASLSSSPKVARKPSRKPTRSILRSRAGHLSTAQAHSNLSEYLDYARHSSVDPNSNVYAGTVYEYTVMEALEPYGFWLRRIGRRNDLGIDHLGHWYLPTERELNVLIQCKATKPTPAMVRELEGTYVGAPARWRGDSVMAILVATQPATPGVRESLQRSRLPMGFAQITADGDMLQFMWNHAAEDARLSGLSVNVVYKDTHIGAHKITEEPAGVKSAISLLWLGKRWVDKTTMKKRKARLGHLQRDLGERSLVDGRSRPKDPV